MKSTGNVMLGIWCAVTSFIGPVWLTMTFMDITGLVYQYDGFVDEGTAGIVGAIELVLWLVIALIPDIWFLKRIRSKGWRFVCYALGVMAVLALFCVALCGWDMVRFLCG